MTITPLKTITYKGELEEEVHQTGRKEEVANTDQVGPLKVRQTSMEHTVNHEEGS
jgi:hypothetical protein